MSSSPPVGLLPDARGAGWEWDWKRARDLRQRVDPQGVLHLDYLPYSHSLLTGFGSAIIGYAVIRWGFGRPRLALAVGLALVSHIVYDLIQHEPDIQIAPGIASPRLGLDLMAIPVTDFLVETALTIACCWYFGGGWVLLAAAVLLSLTDVPMMFAPPGSATPLAANHAILPSVILTQTVLSIAVLWLTARRRAQEIAVRKGESLSQRSAESGGERAA